MTVISSRRSALCGLRARSLARACCKAPTIWSRSGAPRSTRAEGPRRLSSVVTAPRTSSSVASGSPAERQRVIPPHL